MPRYIGTWFTFYSQIGVENKNKAFAYRIYSHFTQQCGLTYRELREKKITHIPGNSSPAQHFDQSSVPLSIIFSACCLLCLYYINVGT